ncbi:hypothetical protein HCG51_16770 [Tolypothrix sp. PCC 7910]|nr:hypothetical protein HCG51_16770 [Tolypothrix sp. PCC 7910]
MPITNYQLPITNYQLPITNYPIPSPQSPARQSSGIPLASQLPLADSALFYKHFQLLRLYWLRGNSLAYS